MDKLNKSIMDYYAIQDKYFEELKKVDLSCIHGILEWYGISDDTPMKDREDLVMQLYADKNNNDFKKAFEKLKQNEQYQKFNEIQKQEGIAFGEYFKNFIHKCVSGIKKTARNTGCAARGKCPGGNRLRH